MKISKSILFSAMLLLCVRPGHAADLWGTYQAIPDGEVLPGGLMNHGGPEQVSSKLQASARDADGNPTEDPAKFCVPVGPFRSMAADRAKIELVPTTDKVVILFQDIAHGDMRIVYLHRSHAPAAAASAQGDSIGSWKQGALTVDTVELGTLSWLNDKGALHSDQLHLNEEFRPILGRAYLEYQMTATDPKALAAPYHYTRYFRKTDEAIADDSCVIESK